VLFILRILGEICFRGLNNRSRTIEGSNMLLRTRIILTAIVSTLFISLVLFISGKIMQNQIQDRFVNATLQGQQLLWTKIIESQHDAMETGMSGITRDREIRKAVADRNIELLKKAAAPAYRRLSTSNIITKMQLLDLDNNVLFSAPQAYLGKSHSTLVKQTLSEGKIMRGIERGEDGELDVVLAFPLVTRGKPVGIAVYIRNVESAAMSLQKSTQSDVLIIDENGARDYSTNPQLFDNLGIQKIQTEDERFQVDDAEGKTYALAITEILDSTNNSTANLISSHDYTESYSYQQQSKHISYLVVLTGFILIAAGMTWYIRKAFKPLEEAVTTLEFIAEGDLSHDVQHTTNDEIGRLMASMLKMVVSLREIVSQFRSMGDNLSKSASEMQDIAKQTSSGIEQQSAETEQVANAMREMTTTVQDVARNAEQAANAARDADHDASSGRNVVQGTIDSINQLSLNIHNATDVIQKLHTESNDIGGVLDVIRGIAEQTNLLALNAAIEAARAGEQGRGFAVVADEVRTLASRTQKSTQDIQKMIERLQLGAQQAVTTMEQSLEQVSSTVQQANQTGQSLETITRAVSTINEMNVQIAGASEEQRMVAEEISRNISSITQISEQSALGARQTSAASQGMQDWTQRLTTLIERFKL
jgi:methyl-accepting chemotaxis protein